MDSNDHGGLPGGSDGKESAFNVGDPGFIPESGRCPEEGRGNPLQYSWLENTMDRGTLWAIAHGVAKSGHAECLALSLSNDHIIYCLARSQMELEQEPSWKLTEFPEYQKHFGHSIWVNS